MSDDARCVWQDDGDTLLRHFEDGDLGKKDFRIIIAAIAVQR